MPYMKSQSLLIENAFLDSFNAKRRNIHSKDSASWMYFLPLLQHQNFCFYYSFTRSSEERMLMTMNCFKFQLYNTRNAKYTFFVAWFEYLTPVNDEWRWISFDSMYSDIIDNNCHEMMSFRKLMPTPDRMKSFIRTRITYLWCHLQICNYISGFNLELSDISSRRYGTTPLTSATWSFLHSS